MRNADRVNLGFGTSSLGRNYTVRGAVRNLETAFDQGVTHFDTAPAYCFGHAEMLLGKFIRDRRDAVTVTTKFGITPRRIPFALMPAFNLVRTPLKRLLSTAVKVSGSQHHHAFSYTTTIDPQRLEDSLHHSLKELGTDYVDYFMLHRIASPLANQDDVVDRLLSLQAAGKVRHLGLAGSFDDAYGSEPLREAYTAIQFGDDLGKRFRETITDDLPGRHYFRFGVFSIMGKAADFLREYNEPDISAAELCLAYYKEDKDFGTTLFSSSRNENIREVVRLWRSDRPLPPHVISRFREFLLQPVKV
ncbi:hypothetical protein GGR26_002898 [Lewinella marina]|uniref:NADP-dependent oxidoreductase domain-containing protein n=1 Tax=Neolewinella marina TaxID=438751 RepID=A0A2G0CBL1_9BACT|nr:aldo/keto reductase [Neolewinella marina]NJB87121.1 hypothetical protein [Neolewinella marina]PHK97351.1 hypothetical protein CGL56_16225 [Neolewinella marina]